MREHHKLIPICKMPPPNIFYDGGIKMKQNFQALWLMFVFMLFGAIVLPTDARAVPVSDPRLGIKVFAGTGNVIATFRGHGAAFSNDLYLDLGPLGPTGGDLFVFNNHTASIGDTVDLGSFTPGTELIFRLHVNNTGYDFFTGPASRNPDGIAHALVDLTLFPGETYVGFEDLFGGGDRDFNDIMYSFSNTTTAPIPEPSTWLLMGTGLAGFAIARLRNRKKEA